MFPALLFAYVLSQFFRAFLAVVAGDLSRDLGLDAAGLANLPAAWFFAFALTQFPVGLALDRFGPRRVLALGLSLAVAGAIALATSRAPAQAILAMALIGTGCAPVLVTGFYLIARSNPPERFAALSSILLGLGSLGDPLSGAPLAFVADRIGWRGAMLGMAAITAASVVSVAVLLRDPPRAVAPVATSVRAGVAEILANRAFWPLVPLSFVSYASVMATRGLWITPYLENVHGLGAPARSLAATAMGLSVAGGALLYAPLVRVLGGVKRTVLAGSAVAAVGWLLLGAAGATSVALALSLLVLAACFGSPFAIVMAHARSFMPTHLIGTGITLVNVVFMGGVATMQWLSGRYVQAASSAGWGPTAIYDGLFLGFGVALAVSVAIYTTAPTEKRGPG